MILATVGTQLPFPRLIGALDALGAGLDEEIIAQIGPDPTPYRNLDIRASLTPEAFSTLFQQARVIVAHAGIGTILSAKRFGKPLIVVPRRHALGEHRNDHQLATAEQIRALEGIHVAWQTEDLPALLARPDLAPATQAQSPSHSALIARLSRFIASN